MTLDPLDQALGAVIRLRRQALGLSQVALGATCGMRPQQLQKYEQGRNRLPFPLLVRIARGLNCRVADLVGDLDLDLACGAPSQQFEALLLLTSPGALPLLRAYALLPKDYQAAMLHLARATASRAGARGPVIVSLFPPTSEGVDDSAEIIGD